MPPREISCGDQEGPYAEKAMIVGHGIDLCSVARIRRMLEEHGEAFLSRTFTEAEVADARRRKKEFEEMLAGRFAAKEAVMKALGTGWAGGVTFGGIEIVNEPTGRPVVRLHGGAAEKARALGITSWHISITHTEDVAIAAAIAEGPAATD